MIQNTVVFIVNGDGSFFKQPPNTKFTANSVNKNSIFVIAPFVNTASIIANFKVAHKSKQDSRVATLTTMQPREITNESYVFDWNVWEVKVPQPALQFLANNRGSEILVSFTVGETQVSRVIPKYETILAEITDTSFVLPEITVDGRYIVKVASYEYENGKYAFFNDTIIADNTAQEYIVYRAKYSGGTTPTVAFKVDPSIPMENFDEYEPTVVEQLIIQTNENSGDIVNLENEVVRIDDKIDDEVNSLVTGDTKFNVVAYDITYSGTLEIGETAWNDTFKCLETRVSDNVVIQHGQEQLQYVRASTNILNGQAVYVSGSTGQRLNVGVANNNVKAQAQSTIAVATENFTLVGADQFGFICNYGLVNGIKTDYATWVTGQPLYLGTNGALTNVIPSGTAYIVRVGIVGRVHGVDGSIMVAPMYMPTMGELSQVDDVTPQTDDIFIRNASGVMVNSQRFKTTETKVVSLENANMFKDVNYNNVNGVLTFTKYDDTTKEIDLPLELLVDSGYYDETTNELVLVLANGSEIRIPVGDLLTDLDAHNIRFNGSGTNYLVGKTDVESAVKELDTQVALKVSTSDIVDNLTSTDTNKALSANQGKVLNDTKENLSNKKSVINDSETEYLNSKAVYNLTREKEITALNNNSLNDIFIGGIINYEIDNNIDNLYFKVKSNDSVLNNYYYAFSKNLLNPIKIISGIYYNASTGVKAFSNRYFATDYINVLQNTNYTVSGISTVTQNYISFYDVNKNYISRSTINITENKTVETPNGCRYLTITSGIYADETLQLLNYTEALTSLMLEEGVIKTTYEAFVEPDFVINVNLLGIESMSNEDLWFYYTIFLEHFIAVDIIKTEQKIKKIDSDIDTSSFNTVRVVLPNYFVAVVGDKLQIFYRGIVEAVNPYNYDIFFKCSKGNVYPRYFEYTPVIEDIGEYDIEIVVKDNNGKTLNSGNSILKVINKKTSPSSNKNILCVGDSITANSTWVTEVNRRLTGSGGTPSADGLTNITFVGSQGTSPNNHEGRSGWTWSNFTGSLSPFYNTTTQTIDFENYCLVNSIGTLDYVVFSMTWNGIEPNKETADKNVEFINEAKKLIDVIKIQYPNCKIILNGIQLPSLNGGMGYNYGADGGYSETYGNVRTVFGLNLAYKNFANDINYFGVMKHYNLSGQFDSEYNMPSTDVVVNSRSIITERRGTNGVHPSTEGYMQIADAIYRAIHDTI